MKAEGEGFDPSPQWRNCQLINFISCSGDPEAKTPFNKLIINRIIIFIFEEAALLSFIELYNYMLERAAT